MSQFDIREFNKKYEDNIQQKINLQKEKEQTRLKELSDPIYKKTLYDLSIGEILINLKNVVFNIFDDLQSFNTFKSFLSIFVKKDQLKSFLSIFVKKDRMFYSGLLSILIAIIMFLISDIFFIIQ
tara:strand:+ start:1514 stop:1888 length:375 start_codon:yes stop_codon:yes gene_type:complete